MDKMKLLPLAALAWIGQAQAQLLTQLDKATVPLTGAELTYIVQNGVSKQVPISQVSAFVVNLGGNQVYGNASNTSHAAVGLAMPSCSSSTNALQWTSGTGFGCGPISVGSISVGSTAISNSSNGYLLFANGGVLGNEAVSNLSLSGGQLTSGTLSTTLFNAGLNADTSHYLRGDGTWGVPSGAGSVTSVALTMPTGFTVTGSPITSSGTFAVTLGTQTGSYALIAPAIGGTPTWRQITAADVSGGGIGTVTSVGLTMPGVFSVAGSPISTSGTLAVTASGTSGGIPYFNAATTMASSAALGANLPVFGGGAGSAPFAGTRSGNTTKVATVSGALTSGDCIKVDASGNLVDYGSGCGTAGTVTDNKIVTWDSTTAVTAQTVTFPVPWTSYTITKVQTSVAGGGSFTAGVKIGGTNVTSCSAISVSGTSNTNTTCTAANTGSANDQISVVISSPSGTVNTAYVSVVFTHTVN